MAADLPCLRADPLEAAHRWVTGLLLVPVESVAVRSIGHVTAWSTQCVSTRNTGHVASGSTGHVVTPGVVA